MGFEKSTILVVDDNEIYSDLILSLFDRLDFRAVLKAEDGNAAVSILERQPVDLILSDWEMPGMNGLELLKWVRSHEKTMHLPFVMMTARVGEADRLEAMEAKATDYIVKPFSPHVLLNRLANALSIRIEISDYVQE